jgi:hypothetical protein
MTDLDALLRSTEALGEITLNKMTDGWWAYINLPAPVGCDAKVKSDTNCPTPTAAVEQMLQRLNDLRRNIGAAVPRIAA